MTYPPPHGQRHYPPQPPPKKGLGAGAIVAITLGSIFTALLLLGVIIAAVSDDPGTSSSGKTPPKRTASAAPAPEQPTDTPTAEEKTKPTPITVTAKRAEFRPSILHDGGAYTSVTVTITNGGSETIPVNPLYVTITDTTGEKHTAELAVDERQLDTVDLAPGEKISGVVTGEGKFSPAYVTYKPGLLGEGVRGDVS